MSRHYRGYKSYREGGSQNTRAQYVCDKHGTPMHREWLFGADIWVCERCIGTPLEKLSPKHRQEIARCRKKRIGDTS